MALAGNTSDYPAYTAPAAASGHYAWVGSPGWTSGFFPGLLWMLGNATDSRSLLDAASAWTAGHAAEQHDTSSVRPPRAASRP